VYGGCCECIHVLLHLCYDLQIHNKEYHSICYAYAEGGNPPVGVPSIVGENGPELFIPKSAGTVIPNGQMSSMMGGQTVNYNGPYIASMNAIDTQSGVQFLAKNKQTIWASYQSANRGVPVSR